MDLNSLALSNEILNEIDTYGSEFYKFIEDLLKDKQDRFLNHLLSHQTTPGERKEFLEFYINFNKSYTGGLETYLKKAHYLLHESTPSKINGKIQKANGHKLHFNTPQFNQMEKKGIETLPQLAFILVAGGLGERLGHSDIKLNLPVDPFTKQTYLQFYCQNIRALQSTICKEFNKSHRIPLAIMVSNKTHKATQQALELNHYFGLDKEQVTLLIQEYVPCFSNKKGDGSRTIQIKRIVIGAEKNKVLP